MNGQLQTYYSENTGEWLDQQNPPVQTTLTCPVTGEEVVGDRWRYPHLASGQIVWWHCPGCQGWHVLKLDIDAHHIEVKL